MSRSTVPIGHSVLAVALTIGLSSVSELSCSDVLQNRPLHPNSQEPGTQGFKRELKGPLTLTDASLPVGTVEALYSHQLAVVGGFQPYSFRIESGRLPAGLTLGPKDGVLSGTPTEPGFFPLVIVVQDHIATEIRTQLSVSVVSKTAPQLVPSVAASAASGIGPLPVFFDATATTSGKFQRTFHYLSYAWDFGDPASTHSLSSGPVASHVYNTPGTYTARLTVAEPGGSVVTKTVSVTVQDPERYYSGNKTAYVSNDSDGFSDVPPDAMLIVTRSFDTVRRYLTSGRRVLLRRGDTFTAKAKAVLTFSGQRLTTLGAYGRGVEPDQRGICKNNPLIEVGRDVVALDIRGSGLRVMDLHFIDDSDMGGAAAISTDDRIQDLLLQRIKTDGISVPIALSHDVVQYQSAPAHDLASIVDCEIDAPRSMGIYAGGDRFSYVGNRVADCLTSHLLRVTYAKKCVIDSNELHRPGGTRHCLKLHADMDHKVYGKWATDIVVRNNSMIGSTPWLCVLGPQDNQSWEYLKDIVLEHNFIRMEGFSTQALRVNSWDTTVRNNVFTHGGGKLWEIQCIAITRGGVIEPPARVEAYHNTYYNPYPGHVEATMVFVEEHEGVAVAKNNLVYAPMTQKVMVTAGKGQVDAAGNVEGVDPKFVDPSKGDFHIKPDSPAIGKGVDVPVIDDYDGSPRDPAQKSPDAGAYHHH